MFSMQYRSESGARSRELRRVGDTKRKTAFLLFFASTHGLRLPLFQAYTAGKLFIFLIAHKFLKRKIAKAKFYFSVLFINTNIKIHGFRKSSISVEYVFFFHLLLEVQSVF